MDTDRIAFATTGVGYTLNPAPPAELYTADFAVDYMLGVRLTSAYVLSTTQAVEISVTRLSVVAPGAPVSDARFKGLILISHGTGGTELNHHNLGTRLARDGYLVAALRHAGDNWQDRSLITSGRYFSERPLQISRVLDALLASPEWGPRIPTERIGAVGHSAGGYSVLALAGAQTDPQRSVQH